MKGDIVVYTTAVRDYAEKVCHHLHIKPVELFTRDDCMIKNGMFIKNVADYYFDVYDDITIIDDIPDIWDKKSRKKCKVISVVPFTGEVSRDDKLIKIEFQNFKEVNLTTALIINLVIHAFIMN